MVDQTQATHRYDSLRADSGIVMFHQLVLLISITLTHYRPYTSIIQLPARALRLEQLYLVLLPPELGRFLCPSMPFSHFLVDVSVVYSTSGSLSPKLNGRRFPSPACFDLNLPLQLPRCRTFSTSSYYGLLGGEELQALVCGEERNCIAGDPGLATIQDEEELWPFQLSSRDSDDLVSGEHPMLALSPVSTDFECSSSTSGSDSTHPLSRMFAQHPQSASQNRPKIDIPTPVMPVEQCDGVGYPNSNPFTSSSSSTSPSSILCSSSAASSFPSSCPPWQCLFNCGQSYKHSSRGSIKRHLLACFRTHRPALKQLSDAQVHTLLAGGRELRPAPALSSQIFVTGRNRLTPHGSPSDLHRNHREQHPGVDGRERDVQDESSVSERLSCDHNQRLIDGSTSYNRRRTSPLASEEARVSKPQLVRSVPSCYMLITNDSLCRDVSAQPTSSFHVGNPSLGEETSLWYSLSDDQKDVNWPLRKSLQAIHWTPSSARGVLDPCVSLPQMIRLLLLDTQTALGG
jgi:hypothetical protein